LFALALALLFVAGLTFSKWNNLRKLILANEKENNIKG